MKIEFSCTHPICHCAVNGLHPRACIDAQKKAIQDKDGARSLLALMTTTILIGLLGILVLLIAIKLLEE